jgi:hypothetical protein
VALAVGRRGGREAQIGVLVVAERRGYRRALAEVSHAVGGASSPVGLVAGIACEPKSAQRLRGEWGGRLDRSLLIRTARDVSAQLAGEWLPRAVPSTTGPGRAGAPGAGLVPGARPAGAGPGSGPPPARTAWSAGPARPASAGRITGHRLPTGAGTQETRAWVPGAREPAARANGRPAAAAAPGPWTGSWGSAGAGPTAGPRGWDEQQLAHHPEADRPRPPWPDPAWPDPAGPGPELSAARVTAARAAADQLTAAELTAAQVAAARLSPAQAAGARRARRGMGRNAGRGAGRGRHAGGPAQPAADRGAAQPSNGRARPRDW